MSTTQNAPKASSKTVTTATVKESSDEPGVVIVKKDNWFLRMWRQLGGNIKKAAHATWRGIKALGRGIKSFSKGAARYGKKGVGWAGVTVGWLVKGVLIAAAVGIVAVPLALAAVVVLLGIGISRVLAGGHSFYDDYIHSTFLWLTRPDEEKGKRLGQYRHERKELQMAAETDIIESTVDRLGDWLGARVVLPEDEKGNYRWAGGIGVPVPADEKESDKEPGTPDESEEIPGYTGVPWAEYRRMMNELAENADKAAPEEYPGGVISVAYDDEGNEVTDAVMAIPKSAILQKVTESGELPQFYDFSWVRDYEQLAMAFEYYTSVAPDPQVRGWFLGRHYLLERWMTQHNRNTKAMRDKLGMHMAMLLNKYRHAQSDYSMPWIRRGFNKQAEELLEKDGVKL